MQLEPLIFPVNFLRHNVIRTLELFFKRVSVICLTEDPELSPCMPGNISSPLYINRICPAPLEKGLGKFRKMLEQMRVWGEQMGLDNKTVAEAVHTDAFKPAGESISSILSSIKRKKADDPLLRARIFLQIALENDMQDDLLEMELLKLEKKKKQLTDIMGGDPHDEETGLTMPPDSAAANIHGIRMLNMPQKRLNAWMKLAGRYAGASLDSWPLGQSVATKDLLDKAYEKATGNTASELLNIHLPGEIDDTEPGTKLMEGVSKLLDYLMKELADGGDQEIAHDELIKNICHRLEVSVNPKKSMRSPGPVFNLTLYPGMHMDDLMPLAAGVKKRKKPPRLFAKWCYGSFYLL